MIFYILVNKIYLKLLYFFYLLQLHGINVVYVLQVDNLVTEEEKSYLYIEFGFHGSRKNFEIENSLLRNQLNSQRCRTTRKNNWINKKIENQIKNKVRYTR